MNTSVFQTQAIKKTQFKFTLTSFIILSIILAAVLMICCIFMPYATATPRLKQALIKDGNEIVHDELNLTNEDLIHISMIKFARMATSYTSNLDGAILYVIFPLSLVFFGLFMIGFALRKKSVSVFVLNLFSLMSFCMQNYDYTDREVIDEELYHFGAANYIFFVCFGLICLLSILLFLLQNKVLTRQHPTATNAPLARQTVTVSAPPRVAYAAPAQSTSSPASKATEKVSDTSAIQELRQYAKLRDEQLITEEEFTAKKKQLLGI